jgi:PKD repeat protein
MTSMIASFVRWSLPAVLVAGGASAQNVVVLPRPYANQEGNSGSTAPFSGTVFYYRQMAVYDASNFVLQGFATPVLITELRYRPDTGSGGSWFTNTLPSVQVDLATCPVNHAAISTVFAASAGPDVRRVFDGPVTIQGGSIGPSPQPWFLSIPLATPFFYDPAAGDLVIDIRRDSSPWTGTTRAIDSVTTPSSANATSLLASHPNDTVGTLQGNSAVVVGVVCAPVTGLHAWFRADQASGTTPLVTSFTQACYSAAPGAQLSWQWDLDGDSLIDSTAANPVFTYSTCGDYTVTLTVSDGVNPPATVTRPNLVRTDDLAVAFSVVPLGGGQWQCTDLTAPPAASWAWDIDDDGITDSVLQNPVLPLGTSCSRTIRLTCTRACKTASTSRLILQAPTEFVADLSGGSAVLNSSPVGNFFDLQVTAPEGVLICGVSSATYNTVGINEVTVWTTPGSYLGKDGDITQWRRVGRGHHMMPGSPYYAPQLATAPMDVPIYLASGSYGVAVYHDAQIDFSSMVHDSVLGPRVGPDMIMHPTAAAPGLTRGSLFSSTAFQGRAFTGILHYTKVSLNNQGGYGVFGFGCAGTAGVPGNRALQQPRLGATMNIELDGLANDAALFCFGASRTTSAFGPLPISLLPLGAPGCDVRVSLDISFLVGGAGQVASVPIAVPGSLALIGSQFFTQGLSFDPAANPLAWVASDASALVIGL